MLKKTENPSAFIQSLWWRLQPAWHWWGPKGKTTDFPQVLGSPRGLALGDHSQQSQEDSLGECPWDQKKWEVNPATLLQPGSSVDLEVTRFTAAQAGYLHTMSKTSPQADRHSFISHKGKTGFHSEPPPPMELCSELRPSVLHLGESPDSRWALHHE